MAKKKKKPIRRERKMNAFCVFCKETADPDYKNYQALERFVSDRAKIIGKKRSGLCSKHQRKFSIAVKRARHLGLLPFAPSI